MKTTFTKQFEWVMGMTGSTSCFSPTRRLLLLLCLILVGVGGAKAQSDVTFKEGIRYSQWVINSRMNDFYANTTKCGFAVYNQDGTQTSARVDGKTSLDYVVGLVGKSIIEASQYYSQYTWAQSFAKPWFLSIQNYGDNFYSKFGTSGGSLDDLNAVKLFLPLRELSATTGKYADAATYGNTTTALNNAIAGLKAHNTSYSIKSGTTAETADKTVAGGWWHKSTYQNQMWLDGSYMGPALFAQLVNYSGKTNNIDATNDWDLIVKQFTILHDMCWNSTDKLPYHAFAADGGTNSTSHSDTWSGLSSSEPYCFHSETYWGRAVGWYFLALVDILEQMDKAGLSSSTGYTTLKGYLEETAEGLAKYQDETGGWYQILDEKSTYSASEYNNGKTHSATSNYIESSATALFTAAYLKAIRLGYLTEATYKTVAVNGYKCLVNNFFSLDSKGNINIFGSCRSAGLGGSGNDYKAGAERFRDGSKAYYLLGYDVAKVEKSENVTEGKVLGAFILAATEYERLYQGPMLLSQDLNDSYTINAGEAISVEVLGDGTASYQWYSTEKGAVAGETNASFKPAASGSYYCIITVTPNSTSAKSVAKAASLSAYTITTNTTQVTVNAASTGEEEDTGNVENSTKTNVTEVVTFPNKTLSYEMTPADATKIVVSATGTGNNNSYLLTGYTGYVKMDSDGSLSLSIPENATNINVTLLSQCSVNNLKLNGDSKTSTTWNGNDTDGYTYSFKIDDSLAGQTYSIIKGDGTSYIHKITITYTTGSSSETPKSSDASATFTYNGSPLTFTGNTATINLESTQAESTITVNATPAAGATITTSSENTSITDNNVISITAPAAGTSASYTYTVKAADNTTTKNYTINVIVAPVLYTVTFNVGTNGTCSTGSTQQSSQGASITLPEVTPAEGYTFDGWYTAETGGTKVDSPYTPTENVTLYAHYTATSSGGSGTGEVIYFTSGTTSSNEDVLTVSSGNAKKDLNVKYKGETYSNGVKMESSTTIYLTLDAESQVTFVFDTGNKKFKIGGTSYTTGADGTYTITLQAGTHTISKDDTSVNLVAVDVQPTGSSLSFTTQPVSATYLACATATELTVEAKVNNVTGTAPTINYQWYSNKTNSTDAGTAIEDETSTSYTPDVSTAGTKYYYCKATATVDAKSLEAYSNIATITVSEPMLTIKTQPVGATYAKGQTGVVELMVEAETNTGNTITYQWYKNRTDGATEITDAKSATYTPEVTEEGTTYYYCVVTAGTLTVTTDIVAIVVNNEQPIYGYKVSKSGLTAPGINTSKYITTTSDETGQNGDKLVKMTFGGWKWNDGKYVKPNSETQITDSWKNSDTESGVTILDGYNYWFAGTQDAVQEDKTAEKKMYGQTRYGWFDPPTRDANGVTTKSNPYTLPVRGSFMTFEPAMNGTLTIYILQNGAWNTFDKATTLDGVSYAKGDIKPGEFRMHAFQVTNQRGLVLEEFAPKYTVTNNQKVDAAYSCSKYAESARPTTFDKTSKDISNWEEFWELSDKERQAVHDNWSVASNNGCQEIIKLENGSFLAIQKAVVKYQFHVTGNETYYFFSNFSKMGFSGATFQPDGAQPTDETTFSGGNSLNDTKAFPTIEKTQNGTIEGTDMPNYKYTIGETEVGKVDGVFIPQFKEITLNRTFTANQWTTLTLPFNLTQTEVQEIFGSGTQLIQLDSATVNNGCAKLHFVYHEIQNVLPGYPYLIKPTQTLSTFTVNNKCINPMIDQTDIPCGAYTFKGVPGYSTADKSSTSGKTGYSVKFEENDIFVSDGNGQMYVSAGSSYGKGYRAWFEKKTEDSSASGKINSISLVIDNPGDDDDNVVTTIDMVDVDPDVFNALGVATGVYNLSGQKVSDDMRNLPKGIYIVNGKKIVRK